MEPRDKELPGGGQTDPAGAAPPEPEQARYASPEAVVADDSLTRDQKERFLAGWLADASEPTAAEIDGPGKPDTDLVARIAAARAQLAGTSPARPAAKPRVPHDRTAA
jgi:hypothetical protein